MTTQSSSLRRFVTRVGLVAGLGAGVAFVMPPATAAAQSGDQVTRSERGRGHGRHRAHRGHRRGHGMHRMLRQLDLSDNQKTQIRAILQSAREQGRELRGSGDRDAMRALRQETRELVLDVLTAEQKAEMAELRERHQERRLDRRVERMTEKLELSETQATRIRAILEAAQTQRRALRNGSEPGDERREAMRTLRQRTKAAVAAVLTPEQREAAEAHRGERRGHR